MATLFSWSSSADTWTFTTGASPTYSTGGSFGERAVWPATTAPAYADADVASSTTNGCRFIYTLASFNSAASHMICNGLASGSLQQFRVDLSVTGMVRIRDASNVQQAEGTVACLVNTEYRFEVYRNGTALTVKVYRVSDNVLRDTVTGTVGGTAVIAWHFGNQAVYSGGTLGAFTYDEVVVTNTAAEVGAPTGSTPLSATVVVSPLSGTPQFTVTVTITPAGGTGTYSYQILNWGDGSTSPPQSSNVFTKVITVGTASGLKTGSYRVTS